MIAAFIALGAAGKALSGTGTNFSSINTGLIAIMVAMLAYGLRAQLANRKMTIDVNGAVRQEFIDEMHSLRAEIKELRGENESLRTEVRQLHGVIDGMRRENLAAQHSAQRVIVESLPTTPMMDDMIRKLNDVTGDGGKRE